MCTPATRVGWQAETSPFDLRATMPRHRDGIPAWHNSQTFRQPLLEAMTGRNGTQVLSYHPNWGRQEKASLDGNIPWGTNGIILWRGSNVEIGPTVPTN
jgi:hypothetical protein